MQIEIISINLLTKRLNHGTRSGVETVALNKKTVLPEALAYIEDYCNKSGFQVKNFAADGSVYYYSLIKN